MDMKVKCNLGDLSNAWTIVNALVPSKPVKPVLTHVKLSAKKGGLELYATDMDVGVKYAVLEAVVEEEGEILVPSSLMGGILKDGWGEEVEISSQKDATQVKLAESKFRILSDTVENFPPFPEIDAKNTATLPREAFCRMVELTRFSVAREDTRYALNGIFLEIKKGTARMVSTDGRRLSRVEAKLTKNAKAVGSAIVPVNGFDEVLRCLSADDEEVVLNIGDNMLQAQTKKAIIFTKLIEGTFPNYEEVIPKGYEKKAMLDADGFLLHLRQAAKLTSEESRAVKFSFEKGKLTLSSSSPEMGDATTEMAIKYDGADFEMRFNPTYLFDVLRALPGKEVAFEMSERTKPGILTYEKEFLYVVMPVNVD
jgi:DNA polymerase-3 subunit beta